MSFRTLLGSLILMATVTGCASNANKPPQATSPSTAAPLTEFEKSKDPPINAKTHFAAGQLAESQGDYQTAIKQYEKSLSIDARYADACFRLGCVQTLSREFKKALATWNRYVTITNGSATAYNNLAFCEELAGNTAAAEGHYRLGIERDPKNEPCHTNYGLMLARHGRTNEAILQLQMVMPPAKAHYDLAAVYEQTGHKQAAKTEYAKALALDPSFDAAKAKLAMIGE